MGATLQPVGRCRVCGSTDLIFLLSLGEQFVNDFPDPGKERDGVRCPIELELCNNCSLVQARYTAPQDFLYSRHYWYKSGVTDTMRRALRDVVSCATKMVELNRNDVVLDVGSNDGTLLRCYPDWVYKVGVEPADNLAEEGSQGVNHLIRDFWSARSYGREVGMPAKIITACGMFYDLENPCEFIRDISKALHPDGVFVAQLMCLRNMVDQGDVGNLAHEHLEFYSLKSLRYMMEQADLQIVDIEHNYVNGGSYRLYVTKENSDVVPFPGASHRLQTMECMEAGLDRPSFYGKFYRRMDENRQRAVEYVNRVVAEGSEVWVYGASTKGNVILQWYGLDDKVIRAAADRSPWKWGRVTVGTGIPIRSEEEARLADPDYFFVLPYAFMAEFVEREKEWRSRGNHHFLVPLPKFRVV